MSTPHPVYGNTPIGTEGCQLENVPLGVLNKWHEMAINLADEWFRAHTPKECDNSPEYDTLFHAAWDILAAAYRADVGGARDLADLLQITYRHAADRGDAEAEVVDLERLNLLKVAAVRIAKLPAPTKRLPALQRGRKLTKVYDGG
jgi:hypothetical protein